ncbi:MAG: transglutaminase domain-containing protein [Lachnospira sp.]
MKRTYSILTIFIIIIMSTSAIKAADNYEDVKDKLVLDCVKNGYLFYDTEQEVINYIQNGISWDCKDGIVIVYPSDSLKILNEFHSNDLPYGNSYDEFFFKIQLEGQIEKIDGYSFAKIVVRRIAKEEHYVGLTEEQAKEADRIADKIANDCRKQNETDSIKAVYNYLCDNIEYDSNNEKGSIYDALISGESVCSGYAGAFQMIMEKMDIPCYLVSGYIDGVAHVWNALSVDNNYYYVDVTYANTTRLKARYWLFGTDVRPDLFNLGIAEISYNNRFNSSTGDGNGNNTSETKPDATEPVTEPVKETVPNYSMAEPETDTVIKESVSENTDESELSTEETVSSESATKEAVVSESTHKETIASEPESEAKEKPQQFADISIIVIGVLIIIILAGGGLAIYFIRNKK